jgi:hypothetical protein
VWPKMAINFTSKTQYLYKINSDNPNLAWLFLKYMVK